MTTRAGSSQSRPERAAQLRRLLHATERAHGGFEGDKGVQIPEALRRGLSGERDAAADVASLLDDVKPDIRRKAADVLFKLRVPEVLPQLNRAASAESKSAH